LLHNINLYKPPLFEEIMKNRSFFKSLGLAALVLAAPQSVEAGIFGLGKKKPSKPAVETPVVLVETNAGGKLKAKVYDIKGQVRAGPVFEGRKLQLREPFEGNIFNGKAVCIYPNTNRQTNEAGFYFTEPGDQGYFFDGGKMIPDARVYHIPTVLTNSQGQAFRHATYTTNGPNAVNIKLNLPSAKDVEGVPAGRFSIKDLVEGALPPVSEISGQGFYTPSAEGTNLSSLGFFLVPESARPYIRNGQLTFYSEGVYGTRPVSRVDYSERTNNPSPVKNIRTNTPPARLNSGKATLD
jgi:hypothetical protein